MIQMEQEAKEEIAFHTPKYIKRKKQSIFNMKRTLFSEVKRKFENLTNEVKKEKPRRIAKSPVGFKKKHIEKIFFRLLKRQNLQDMDHNVNNIHKRESFRGLRGLVTNENIPNGGENEEMKINNSNTMLKFKYMKMPHKNTDFSFLKKKNLDSIEQEPNDNSIMQYMYDKEFFDNQQPSILQRNFSNSKIMGKNNTFTRNSFSEEKKINSRNDSKTFTIKEVNEMNAIIFIQH